MEDYLNLKGIIIGNGVMDFTDYGIERSEVEFMIEHEFVDHRLVSIYRSACQLDM